MRTRVCICFFLVLIQCSNNTYHDKASQKPGTAVEKYAVNPKGKFIYDRLPPPEGFKRVKVNTGSFAQYLRNLPLKEDGSRVYTYNGSAKLAQVHVAVIDMDIGKRDLQQCADAVMRLRAEYLYVNRQYDDIHFNLTNGFRVDYSRWIQGYRVAVNGNKTTWIRKEDTANNYPVFRRYMDFVFIYAGSQSLSRELTSVALAGMQPGDVFIQGGSPGHAVIVVDMAYNPDTGEKSYLLAQSYMPAQDIHILKNPANQNGSPWYRLHTDGEKIETPEWTFYKRDLKRFRGE